MISLTRILTFSMDKHLVLALIRFENTKRGTCHLTEIKPSDRNIVSPSTNTVTSSSYTTLIIEF